ncbi:MAG: hypothetical protein ACXWTK_06260 [Methylobacter sp.]
MKHLLFCLTLLFSILTANSLWALQLPDNCDGNEAQFFTRNTGGLKNPTLTLTSVVPTENSSESTSVGAGEGSPKPDGNSERLGVGTGGAILKFFQKSRRLGVGTGGAILQRGYETERLGVGTGSKPKPNSNGNSDENY